MSRNTVKTTFILTLLAALFVGFGALIGGKTGLIIGLVIGLLFTGGSYWFSDTIAIKAARAAPVSEAQMPDYYAIVRDLTTRAGLPMPKLYVTPDAQPNAFATGRNPDHAAVAVTQGILRDLHLGRAARRAGPRDLATSATATSSSRRWRPRSPWPSPCWRTIARWGAIFGGGRDNDGPNIFEILASQHPRPPGGQLCCSWPCPGAGSTRRTAPAPG